MLNERLPNLEQLHKRAINAVSGEEASQLSKEIEAVTTGMNSLAAGIRTKLSKLSGKKDSRMALTQQKKLGKAFMDVTKRIEDVQTHYKSVYRQQLHRQYMIVNPEASQADLDALGNDQQVYICIHILLDDVFTSQQINRPKDTGRNERKTNRDQEYREIGG